MLHIFPVKSGGQIHVNVFAKSCSQSPLLKHGLGSHGSTEVLHVLPVKSGGQVHVNVSSKI
uniref:Uncharacterized protein n=1 Tax=Amphimedon queenslandica TaxID=400682 RepID=A0A1X7VQQ6_AMPQE